MGYIIILGASLSQKPVYLEAKKLRLKIVGIDKNLNSPCKKYCHNFIFESFKNTKACIQQLKKLNVKFSGIVTFGAEASIEVATIAKYFNLNSVKPKVAKWTTYKSLRSKRLNDKRVLIPKFLVLKKIENKLKFKFPFIVKPVDSSGSRGVSFVKNKVEYLKAFKEAQRVSLKKEVIVEEYIKGKELSIEGFVLNKKLFVTGIADRYYLDIKKTQPSIVEFMGVMPSKINIQLADKVNSVFNKSIKALEIDGGPVKGDLIIKKNNVYVLEIASRTSTAFAAEMQRYSSGINLPKILVLWSIGKKIEKKLIYKNCKNFISHRYLNHKPGKIIKMDGLKESRNSKGIKILKMLKKVKKGDFLDKINYMNRILYVISCSNDYQKSIELSKKALRKIKIFYERKK